ncbi:hypothetical protein BT96DRAFT_1025464 [Gymnopus androsaceus JB14]|uniref:DUF6534 domain-containing protein n=1 Tax=Gymnopus androsaceus JB14 TaxID=1447944 RepID=A0A6A4GRZ4_9AGAR|nr:hypothetical protein BT96DRAFT_1025464 [Gymnopus androsaceus JB14]
MLDNRIVSADPAPSNIPGIAWTTGPIMIGIMLNWGFMGVLAAQIYYYNRTFSRDKKKLKFLVYGLGVLDTLQSTMITADAFHWFVYGFGNTAQLNDIFLNCWDVPFLDAIISLVAQMFYCWRIYVLQNGSLIFPVIIMTVSLTQCGAGITTAVKNNHGKFSLIGSEVVETTIWLVGSVVADVLIACVLTWCLLKSRSKDMPVTHSKVNQIIRLIVETNSITAGVALISVILFFAVPQHSAIIIPSASVIGKMYTNCLVAVLNNRQLGMTENVRSIFNPLSSTSGQSHALSTFRSTITGNSEVGSEPQPVKVQVLQEIQADYEAGETLQDLEQGRTGKRGNSVSV